MAVLPADLIHPKGRIHPDLFPEWSAETLATAIEGWITEALANARVAILPQADQDRASRAWSYHRAFDSVCIAMAANPSTAALGDAVSSSYAKDQRDTICRMATDALAQFEALAPVPTVTERRTGGQAVTHDFAW